MQAATPAACLLGWLCQFQTEKKNSMTSTKGTAGLDILAYQILMFHSSCLSDRVLKNRIHRQHVSASSHFQTASFQEVQKGISSQNSKACTFQKLAVQKKMARSSDQINMSYVIDRSLGASKAINILMIQTFKNSASR